MSPEPRGAAAWRALSDRLRFAGDSAGADDAHARHLRASVSEPDLAAAADALVDGRFAIAAQALRAILAKRPTDVAAVTLLGEVAARTGRDGDAERLFAQALELAPQLTGVRYGYALALHRLGKPAQALAQADLLLGRDPRHPIYRHLRAASLVGVGRYDEAVQAYADVLADHPDQPLSWMSYGHALKTLGRQAEAVAAYRTSLRLSPALGEAWWSLANLKSVRFEAGDVAAMQAGLDRTDLASDDRFHLLFALGKAHEDAGRPGPAFAAYQAANALRRAGLEYHAEETTTHMRRCKALLSPSFFAARAGQGSAAADPIFIVGLPRSGSTLIEQILASHSQVEGTQELPDIGMLAARLGGPARRASQGVYPDIMAALAPDELKALGEEYLARTRIHRRLGRAAFTDKTPDNFAHLGLIQLILPNARIIDARRHPLGCGFSAFKQHFAQGQAFAYSLDDIGRYYRDYVELMAHFDTVLPGRVHRVIYEEMVSDPEREVRRLLEYCGLAFEAGCLRFYETERGVRTASSEQVRQPIFTEATDHWRQFEPFLDDLKAALGPVLDAYPQAPTS